MKYRQDDLPFTPSLADDRAGRWPSGSKVIVQADKPFIHPMESLPISCPGCDEVSCGRICSECGVVIWTSGHLQHLEHVQIE